MMVPSTRSKSATQVHRHTPIIDLPDEILLQTFETLHAEHEARGRRTMAFRATADTQWPLHALTARRFHVLAQPLFYRTVVLASRHKALYHRLI
jgi:hypothetical protein